ncbi:hypothetical protein [Chamaesiphon sp.]|uniref:hypothetical protein n=1 Tax=Chamaesiphon sp. TaxID=2814140 RepID=UPI003593102F
MDIYSIAATTAKVTDDVDLFRSAGRNGVRRKPPACKDIVEKIVPIDHGRSQ